MRAWVYRKDKTDDSGIHIFQEDIPVPVPQKDQILIKIEKVSVCGTDETLFRGDLKRVPDGIVPGHEFYGRIEEVGAEVRGYKVGRQVAGESHYFPADVAEPGIIGLWGAQLKNGESLPPLNGAYAEYLCLPAECVHPVPGELISDGFWPSLFEAIGNDYFLIKRVKSIHPKHLGIFGSGPHGLFAQIFAKHFQIPRITAFEVDPYRRKFAQELHAADSVLDPSDRLEAQVTEMTNGGLFDATIDMVGKQGQGFEACCKTTRSGGTIYLFGLFSDRFSIEGIPGNEIIFKMKTVDLMYQKRHLKVEGITGREGIWGELIETVSREKHLQEHLMRPVTVMGSLERLGQDTRSPKKDILKRAYHAFGKQ